MKLCVRLRHVVQMKNALPLPGVPLPGALPALHAERHVLRAAPDCARLQFRHALFHAQDSRAVCSHALHRLTNAWAQAHIPPYA
jgi:hypothetical protein